MSERSAVRRSPDAAPAVPRAARRIARSAADPLDDPGPPAGGLLGSAAGAVADPGRDPGRPAHGADPAGAAAASGVSPADVARVETLLAAVRDLVSSLRRMSGQLEREVAVLLTEVDRARTITADDLAGPDAAALAEENAQLREALEGRAVIEQAKGMLMARHPCTPDEAFQILVAMSRHEQRKVREIAAELVESSRPAAGRRATLDLTSGAQPTRTTTSRRRRDG